MTDLDALWNNDDPAGTEAAFRTLLAEAERAGGVFLLELLTQLARTQSLQRKFAEAHALLDRVEAQLAPDMLRAGMSPRPAEEARVPARPVVASV